MSRRLAVFCLERLPMLLLAIPMLVFFLAFPYGALDADVTTFGLMGEDIVRYGHFTTFAYGQNYLFSTTPYLYALVRLALPLCSSATALALAGTVQTLAGFWLLYEAFLRTQRKRNVSVGPSAWAFALLLAASPYYFFALARNSSIEMSVLALGLIFMGGALAREGKRTGWFLLGLATSFSLYTRPQMALFGLVMLLALGVELRRAALRGVLFWAGGFLAGWLPWLAHLVWLAPCWPFTHHIPLVLGDSASIRASAGRILNDIVPRLFGLGTDPWTALVPGAILLAGAVLFPVIALRRGGRTAPHDWVFVLGSLILLVVMALYPSLTPNSTATRYCLHLYTAAAWLFAAFALPALRRPFLPPLVAALALLFALPAWNGWARDHTDRDAMHRRAVKEFIPELHRHDRLFLTDYWDAYLLAFLDGSLRVEAFPWQIVRTYGKYSQDDFRQAVWLIREGFGGSTWRSLEDLLGPEAMGTLQSEGLTARCFHRGCELWSFPDPLLAPRLMTQFHPLYFRTPYPPGSGPIRREEQAP